MRTASLREDDRRHQQRLAQIRYNYRPLLYQAGELKHYASVWLDVNRTWWATLADTFKDVPIVWKLMTGRTVYWERLPDALVYDWFLMSLDGSRLDDLRLRMGLMRDARKVARVLRERVLEKMELHRTFPD